MYDQVQNQIADPLRFSRNDLIDAGLKAATLGLRDQVKLWERHTDEKADVARDLMRGVKALLRECAPDQRLRTLSIGSSEEPQFQLLHALSDGGLWLYDCDPAALGALKTRIERSLLNDVHLVQGDYLQDFNSDRAAEATLQDRLGGVPFDLVTLHHALYYSRPEDWPDLVRALCNQVLSAPGRMHLALMSSTTKRPYSTTWLYNRFAEKFCGTRNTQNLLDLPARVKARPGGGDLYFSACSSAVRCRLERFEDLMAVVWMIMLYPQVHDFSTDQRVEITEFVLDEFWLPGRDLVQVQDYVTITRSPAIKQFGVG